MTESEMEVWMVQGVKSLGKERLKMADRLTILSNKLN